MNVSVDAGWFCRIFLFVFISVVTGCTTTPVEPESSGPSEEITDGSDGEVGDQDEPGPADPSDESRVPGGGQESEQSDSSTPSEPDEVEDEGPLPGFGEISGACGVLDLMTRQQTEPFLIQSAIDFGDDPYDDSDLNLLTDGGREIISDGNAGGSSLLSEVFAYEVLARCEDAQLLKTETEILYEDPAGKKTDLLVMIGESRLGVSVTRAVGFPRDDPYTVQRAQDLLEQKLDGVVSSTNNVSEEDAWAKQILHVVAYAHEHAQSLEAAYELLSEQTRSNTVVWVTVSHGDDGFLY